MLYLYAHFSYFDYSFHADIHNAYVFMVNKMGQTLLHPLLPSPHSLTEDPAHVTIDKLEQEPELHQSLQSIVRQQPGYKVYVNSFLDFHVHHYQTLSDDVKPYVLLFEYL